MAGKYRMGVGMVLVNQANQVFVAQRIDNPGPAWQMPQGGLDQGEEPLAGVLRELEEETSIPQSAIEIVAESQGWLTYDFPEDLAKKLWGGGYKGQKQKWFLVRFTGHESQINLETAEPEFSDWKWVSFEDTQDLIVQWKRPLYALIYQEFKDLVQ